MMQLLAFLLRRTLGGLFTIWALFTITFVIYWAIPNQPASLVYNAPHLSDYQIKHADHLLGIDKPKLTLYGDYLWHLVQGDFGKSWAGAGFTLRNNDKVTLFPVWPQLQQALPVTLSLMLGGAFLVVLLALPLGAIAGKRIGSLSDRTISLLALIGICTHPMVVGLILRGLFVDHWHWAPPIGYCPITGPSGHPAPGQVVSGSGGGCGGVVDWASHLALPWITFALLFLALYTRMIRASVAETLPEDHVRTARAKGVGEIRLMLRHVIPNAGLRVLTMIGMEIGTVIGVAVYIEAVFGLGGLGSLAINAFIGGPNGSALDLPVVLGAVTMIAVIVVVGNLIVDALYAIIDPRLRFAHENTRTKSLAGGVI